MEISGSGRGLVALLAASLYLGFLARPQANLGQQVAAGGGSNVVSDGESLQVAESSSDTGSGNIGEAGSTASRSGTSGRKSTSATSAGLACERGRNGDKTDVGITSAAIRLATTAVLDGPAKTLLRDSPTAMAAVINKVNRAGGICGRLLELRVVNDSFEASTGQRFIENFIEEGYFALPVVPSAEGLSSAINAQLISRGEIPVVGTDGMRIEQYTESWVWPVATATISTMRIMAEYGARVKGAKTFAIVWDSKYKFGKEGADAFKSYVQKQLGGSIVADIEVDPNQSSYSTEVNEFNRLCANGACDMVAFLLLPDAGVTWFASLPTIGSKYTSAAQTLFTDDFAGRCVQVAEQLCNGLAVWTGYVPAIPPFDALPDVEGYVNDVRATRPGIDVTNQFVQGAYLGISVFVDALQRVGPNLTRRNLRQVLDSMTYETDLSSALTWRTGNHAANTKARSFSIVVSRKRFTGWRDEQTGWVQDPLGGP